MAASYASGPRDPAPLSAREQRILAAIEDELWCSDPDLGLRMTAAGIRRRHSRAAGGFGVAAAVVLLLVLLAALPPAWRAVLGLVLTLGVLPWLLLYRLERHSSKE